MTILDDILHHKRNEVATAQRTVSLDQLHDQAARQAAARGFATALRVPAANGAPRLIAEIKKRSPSKGSLAPALDVVSTARLYESCGAAAISVLTDARFFAGHLDDLRAVRAAVSLPVLRKDFLFTSYQVVEARAAGADAVLLVVAALASPLADPARLDALPDPAVDDQLNLDVALDRLRALLGVAHEVGLDCLVEVHDEAEMAVAARAGAQVVGVNNRDLRTFETKLEVTERLAPLAPAGAVLVSESGIDTAADVQRVRRAGAGAILVGTSIVGAPDPAAKIRELLG
jgi:indole-3-glycerol phosphate synthase